MAQYAGTRLYLLIFEFNKFPLFLHAFSLQDLVLPSNFVIVGQLTLWLPLSYIANSQKESVIVYCFQAPDVGLFDVDIDCSFNSLEHPIFIVL